MISFDETALLDALDAITWYNGLAEFVLSWKKIKPESDIYSTVSPDINYGAAGEDEKTIAQLQFIWMIAVELFGDYGTSPRYGWIEDIERFYEFIDRITYLYQDHEKREQQK